MDFGWETRRTAALTLMLVLSACGGDPDESGRISEATIGPVCEQLAAQPPRCDGLRGDDFTVEACRMFGAGYPARCRGTADDLQRCLGSCSEAACRALTACDPVAGKGSPPRLLALRFTPSSFSRTDTGDIEGEVDFEDADGDVTRTILISPRGATPGVASDVRFALPTGRGRLVFASLPLGPFDRTGKWAFEIVAEDSKGNRSAPIAGEVDVR